MFLSTQSMMLDSLLKALTFCFQLIATQSNTNITQILYMLILCSGRETWTCQLHEFTFHICRALLSNNEGITKCTTQWQMKGCLLFSLSSSSLSCVSGPAHLLVLIALIPVLVVLLAVYLLLPCKKKTSNSDGEFLTKNSTSGVNRCKK